MLDGDGFLAETHASHVAIVEGGRFYTPFVRCCPPGVTRKVLLEYCCKKGGILGREDDITVERLMNADEVLIMGTVSALTCKANVRHEKLVTRTRNTNHESRKKT